jgi:hypothetical protein
MYRNQERIRAFRLRRDCCIPETVTFHRGFISPPFGNNAAQGRSAREKNRPAAARSKGETQ